MGKFQVSISRFVPGQFCGCVVSVETTLTDTDDDGEFDRSAVVPIAIVSQCEQHAHFAGAEALYGEIRHFTAIKHRPDTCDCSIVYWFDDRLSEEDRIHNPVNHPIHTKRCARHAHLTDHVEHHDEVAAENRAISEAKGATGSDIQVRGGGASDQPFVVTVT